MGTSVQNVNAQIADRNSKLDAAKSSVNSAVESANSQVAAANGQIDTANGQIESARAALDTAIAAAQAAGNTDLVNSLTAAKSNLPSVSKVDTTVSADTTGVTAVDQVTAPDVEISMPGIDTASLTATLQNMKTSLETLQSAAGQDEHKTGWHADKIGNTFRCEHSGSTDDTADNQCQSTEYRHAGTGCCNRHTLPEM